MKPVGALNNHLNIAVRTRNQWGEDSGGGSAGCPGQVACVSTMCVYIYTSIHVDILTQECIANP